MAAVGDIIRGFTMSLPAEVLPEFARVDMEHLLPNDWTSVYNYPDDPANWLALVKRFAEDQIQLRWLTIQSFADVIARIKDSGSLDRKRAVIAEVFDVPVGLLLANRMLKYEDFLCAVYKLLCKHTLSEVGVAEDTYISFKNDLQHVREFQSLSSPEILLRSNTRDGLLPSIADTLSRQGVIFFKIKDDVRSVSIDSLYQIYVRQPALEECGDEYLESFIKLVLTRRSLTLCRDAVPASFLAKLEECTDMLQGVAACIGAYLRSGSVAFVMQACRMCQGFVIPWLSLDTQISVSDIYDLLCVTPSIYDDVSKVFSTKGAKETVQEILKLVAKLPTVSDAAELQKLFERYWSQRNEI